jgi:hypothetical protein
VILASTERYPEKNYKDWALISVLDLNLTTLRDLHLIFLVEPLYFLQIKSVDPWEKLKPAYGLQILT